MTENPTTATKEKPLFASTKAKFLWFIKPIIEVAREESTPSLRAGAVGIEPAEIGGVYVTATCGRSLVAIYDPDGRASEPMTLDIPDRAILAARPPAPIEFQFEEEIYEHKLPEWCQPGEAMFTHAGMIINPAMRPPQFAERQLSFYPALASIIASTGTGDHWSGMDYRAAPGIKWHTWRKIFRTALENQPTTGPTQFNPQFPAMFGHIHEALELDEGRTIRLQYRHTTMRSPEPKYTEPDITTVQIEGHPEILLAWAHYRFDAFPDVPAHFLTDPATQEATG